jgi:hypothetical protein
MPDKTKDGPKAREDLKTMGIREDLHVHPEPKDIDKGKHVITSKREHYYNPSCFTLSKKELDQIFSCLEGIKVSSGYCRSIRRYVDTKNKVFVE